MSIREAYTTWSDTYDTDRNLTRDLDAQVTRRMLGELHPAVVLELGCGTGKNTSFLAGQADTVLALDFSEGMMGRAQQKVRQPHVYFAQADFTRPWPCASASVDLLVCNLVLEHIRDLAFIFAQAGRVLKSGGQFFLCELHPLKQDQGKKAVYQHEGQTVEVPAFVHHSLEYVNNAHDAGFMLSHFGEWWHEADNQSGIPRLMSLLLSK
ncbi:MAG: class I SAM-dependent methyltransferase [Pleurocapsa minor GSE-CHR-MK-17-07R]|jgi:malonyl-CoA O-methyltransferase|nr:class I SAM-dependent methyltransferase [Pleurocapsa minor GSE-CHR-MK 17-07R]